MPHINNEHEKYKVKINMNHLMQNAHIMHANTQNTIYEDIDIE